MLGVAPVNLKLQKLGDRKFAVKLYVVEDREFRGDMLLGRDFIAGENISLKYDLENAEGDEAVATVNLFDSLECEAVSETNEQAIRNAEIDYDAEAKQQLIQTIVDAENTTVEPIVDDYCVKVPLKDNSVYAYYTRRAALRTSSGWKSEK